VSGDDENGEDEEDDGGDAVRGAAPGRGGVGDAAAPHDEFGEEDEVAGVLITEVDVTMGSGGGGGGGSGSGSGGEVRVGSGGYHSPRHRMPFNSRKEGSKRVG